MGVAEALGMGTREWVETRLGGYVRYALDQRREVLRELVAPEDDGGFGMTQRQAAEVLGLSQSTVSDALHDRNRSDAEPAYPGAGPVLIDFDHLREPDDGRARVGDAFREIAHGMDAGEMRPAVVKSAVFGMKACIFGAMASVRSEEFPLGLPLRRPRPRGEEDTLERAG
jgi:hypothetical protein